jgi:hypothetical protein
VAKPCIKGIAIRSLLVDVGSALAQGRVTDAQVSRYLTDDDRALIRDSVLDSTWCPIASYRRMTELLREVDGSSNNEYVRKRGAAAAQRLISLGVHQQVTSLGSTGRTDNREQALHNLKLTATLWNSFFNFGEWTVFEDAQNLERYGLQVRNAAAMPDVGWHAVQGFIERLSEESTHMPAELRKEVSPDGVIRLIYARPKFARR